LKYFHCFSSRFFNLLNPLNKDKNQILEYKFKQSFSLPKLPSTAKSADGQGVKNEQGIKQKNPSRRKGHKFMKTLN